MKPLLFLLAFAFSLAAFAQEPAIAPARPLPVNPPTKQATAASASQDTSGDQVTTPPGAKGSTLIGCLVGPDKGGQYMVRNMAHRTGVHVVGPDDLKNDSGSKVKLTGQWQPLPPDQLSAPQDASKKAETHRFQATDVEVLAQKCKPPDETTPVSKNKPQKPTTYDTPSDDSK